MHILSGDGLNNNKGVLHVYYRDATGVAHVCYLCTKAIISLT